MVVIQGSIYTAILNLINEDTLLEALQLSVNIIIKLSALSQRLDLKVREGGPNGISEMKQGMSVVSDLQWGKLARAQQRDRGARKPASQLRSPISTSPFSPLNHCSMLLCTETCVRQSPFKQSNLL